MKECCGSSPRFMRRGCAEAMGSMLKMCAGSIPCFSAPLSWRVGFIEKLVAVAEATL